MSAGLQDREMEEQIVSLQALLSKLSERTTVHDKLELLNEVPAVQELSKGPGFIRTFLAGLTPDCEYVLKAVLAIGQGPIVFRCPKDLDEKFELLRVLLQQLIEVEKFYQDIGGIVGYHLAILRLIQEAAHQHEAGDLQERFLRPSGLDLSRDSLDLRKATWEGLSRMPEMAEIYPVGGAGDRLSLRDARTDESLPAARLRFGGRTLLEGMVRDLQAREFLHYKICHERILTPVAMMTSEEKDNRRHIEAILAEANNFGRPKSSFYLFSQGMVPVVNIDGNWCLHSPLQLQRKPGGHGVMWMLARDSGALAWLREQGREKVLVRQINNPIADTDGGTLGFQGVGLSEAKDFGFASCRRLLNTAEGVNVLRETSTEGGLCAGVTNIEYTEFSKHGIEEAPIKPGSPYSEYPANTNILFANLNAVEAALERCPIPGMLINMKSQVDSLDSQGNPVRKLAGRLESTMQNIADAMTDSLERAVQSPECLQLRTYLTSNHRSKTISVTKRAYVSGKPIEETPEGCFSAQQRNNHKLFGEECGMHVPVMGDKQCYVRGELPLLIQFHPALGPLYSIIAQKVRGGSMARGSELQLEISELDMEEVHVRGSLSIRAEDVMGDRDEKGNIRYGDSGGKCRLKNVRIENAGIDASKLGPLWKNEIPRKECLSILLLGNAEFEAENVTISGEQHFEVPAGHRLKLSPSGNGFQAKLEPIVVPSWFWSYQLDDAFYIRLKK